MRATTANDLARRQGQHRQCVERFFHLTAESRFEVFAFGLPTGILGRSLHDVIDDDAGNAHVFGIHRSRFGEVFDLHDHDAAGIVGRHRHGEAFILHALVFEGDIAVLIGRRTTQKRHVERKRFVEQVFFALKLNDFNKLIFGGIVHLATAVAGVDERAQTNFCQKAGAPRRYLAPKVDDNALGQTVTLNLSRGGHIAQGESRTHMGARPLRHKPFAGLAKACDAALFPIAHRASLFEIYSARVAAFGKTIPDRTSDFFSPARKAHARKANRSPIGNKGSRLGGSNEFRHKRLLSPGGPTSRRDVRYAAARWLPARLD